MYKKKLFYAYFFLFLFCAQTKLLKATKFDSVFWQNLQVYPIKVHRNTDFLESVKRFKEEKDFEVIVNKLFQRIGKSSLSIIFDELMEKYFSNILKEQNKLNKFIASELLLKEFHKNMKLYTNLNDLEVSKIEEIKNHISLLDKNLNELDDNQLELIKKELLIPYTIYFYHLNNTIQEKFTIYKDDMVFPDVNLAVNVDEQFIQNKFQKNIHALIKKQPNIKLRCAIVKSIFDTEELFDCY